MIDDKKIENISELRFLLITHTFATGPTQELKDYFVKNNNNFSFIEHPFSYNKNQKQSKITFFENGKEKKHVESIVIKGPDIFYFIKDFFYTIYFVIKTKKKYDVCIAADNLNAFSAWILKKFSYVDKLVYWTIDYTPKRFENNLLNKIYHWIDRFCCYKADLIWNSSKKMKDARIKNGMDIKKCVKEIIVCDGCHFNDIERLSDDKVDRSKLVFMGHLVRGKGVNLIINVMPELIKKYPDISLTIVGAGQEEETLKNLITELNIKDKVVFTGFIKDHKDLEKTIASCGVAVAPYVPDPNSYTFFSDVGKVKVYLACGLPVLVTDVPEIAKDIQDQKAGLIFDYNKESLIKNIGILLDNDKEYFEYRHNAIDLAEGLDWNSIFRCAISKTLTLIMYDGKMSHITGVSLFKV